MTMLEKVARALCRAKPYCQDWDDVEPAMKEVWLSLARAAIEAMREPTKEMLAAGGFYEPDECPACGYTGLWESRSPESQIGKGHKIFSAMIDAALTEQKSPEKTE